MKEIRLRKPAGLDQLETRHMELGPVTRGAIRVCDSMPAPSMSMTPSCSKE
jgi:hypothetical protein